MKAFRWLWTLLLWTAHPFRNEVGAIVSPVFGEMRGKIGGVVWSRNKGGQYARLRSTPTNPNTARQQATRNYVGWCSTNWGATLTEAQREQWREWAEMNSWTNTLGITIFLTALDWYVMVNSRLLDAGETPIATPDDLSAPGPLTTMVLAVPTATTCTITFTPALPSGFRLVLWGSGPLSDGQNPNFRQMRLIGYSAADAASPVTFALPYTMPDGAKLKVYCGVMNDRGRVSTFLTDDEKYTAP